MHFCSFQICGQPKRASSPSNKVVTSQQSCPHNSFDENLFHENDPKCAGEERIMRKREREKRDRLQNEAARGNRISWALHPTRSQSRLTTGRDRDAQTRAKFLSSKQRPPIVPVRRSISLSGSHMDTVAHSFNRTPPPKKPQDVCTTSFPLSKRWHKKLDFGRHLADCWSFLKSLHVFAYSSSTWKISSGLRVFICLPQKARSSDRCSVATEFQRFGLYQLPIIPSRRVVRPESAGFGQAMPPWQNRLTQLLAMMRPLHSPGHTALSAHTGTFWGLLWSSLVQSLQEQEGDTTTFNTTAELRVYSFI